MNIPEEPDLPPQINIVPMIDVIFAILTFFIMATLFLVRSEGLPVNLPQAQTARPQNYSSITVTINATGAIALNRESVQIDELAKQVKTMMGQQTAVVVINADEAVNYGRVIAVMDELRSIKGVQLGMATRSKR